jgi:ketoreductase RED1
MDKMQLGEVTQDPEVRERLIEAVEKTYGAYSYDQLSEERDRKQLAVLTALASVNHGKKEK